MTKETVLLKAVRTPLGAVQQPPHQTGKCTGIWLQLGDVNINKLWAALDHISCFMESWCYTNFEVLSWEILIFLKYERQVCRLRNYVKRLLVELRYTLHNMQTVIIFIYLFMITPLSNVFSVAFWNLTPAAIQR